MAAGAKKHVSSLYPQKVDFVTLLEKSTNHACNWASNNIEAGRGTNRRTRIIILPKLDQFYELLNPSNVPGN